MSILAFGMPFIALAFMIALAYGIARHNRPDVSAPVASAERGSTE